MYLSLLQVSLNPCLQSQSVGDGTGVKPIYEVQMHNKGLPFLSPSADILLQHIAAKECCGRPPVTFQRVEKVRMTVASRVGKGHMSVRAAHVVC